MTAPPDQHSNVVNVHLKATEHDERIVFLHSVENGPASQSYGLQVAQLAGVPSKVIQQAKLKLQHLERLAAPSSSAKTYRPNKRIYSRRRLLGWKNNCNKSTQIISAQEKL